MFGEKKLKEVIDFDRDEGYLLREKLIENGWQVIHDFHDGTILSKFDNYYREETIAFLDDYTQGYEVHRIPFKRIRICFHILRR